MTPSRRVVIPPRAALAARASWFALLLLAVLWEAWLAPLRPGGSWLVLKALPLVALSPSVARLDPRGLQWAVLLVPFYLAEGATRLFEPMPFRACAAAELLLGGLFFVAAIVVLQPYKRAARARKETNR